MRLAVYPKLLLITAIFILALFAQGCGLSDLAEDCEINGLPNSTALCGAAAGSGTSTYVFAHSLDGKVVAYEADSTTGALTFLDWIAGQGAPDAPGIVAHPTRPFIYTLGDGKIDGLYFDKASEQLSRISGFPVNHFRTNHSMLLNPSGTKLFVGTQSNTIIIYSINQATGALTLLSNAAWQDCYSLALNAAETRLYCIDQGSLHTGNLNASGVFLGHIASNPGSSTGLTSVPNTSFLYSDSSGGGAVVRHTINAGTGIAGGGAATGVNGAVSRPVVHPSGSFLILPILPNEIRSYAIQAGTGALALADTLATPLALRWTAFSPNGTYLYHPTGGAFVGAASFNSSTGELAVVSGSPFSTQSGGVPGGVATASY